MVFRPIETSYKSEPVGYIEDFDEYHIIDSENNVYTRDFIKVGFYDPIVALHINAILSPKVKFWAVALLALFPVPPRRKRTEENFASYLTGIMFTIVVFLITGIMKLIAVGIGWLINKILELFQPQILKVINKVKMVRLICPHFWFYDYREIDPDLAKKTTMEGYFLYTAPVIVWINYLLITTDLIEGSQKSDLAFFTLGFMILGINALYTIFKNIYMNYRGKVHKL